MKTKVLLLLALTALVFGSLTVDTLAGYNSSTSFGISITPDIR